ncbi:DUF448 domain-containing protein [Campylobacter hyointestinalis]|uniref:Protein of uncharacterized function (DUF448) n=5 Tax=Campylobacter hyointestinalis TaxID=198 RepID=A0A0S4RFP5_CAMHY|nr:DUF448 domain-containing protein [Campylobacter hyointestinalis]ANE33138.1 putative nucleic-acid-binding protein (DUF448 domain) [Campylobacter hyointestinalis subsp. hyointestinalis LMG 9260]KEA44790.1 hypothetical protein CR67_03240 [Campylobacter hyointestinalis subsp. hyointestinalis]MDL2346401.1 DUF448 domain-containing protein [Campylobacter hyointestinalis]MDL2348141.1 DUF448 domain-containing protein [Campylobacter hyointestinalis]MDL2349886.1 DUF448 domain-containing protein [Campy
MNKNHKPIRMCVVCKGRFFQNELFKFASIDDEIIPNPKNTRSFYLCKNCMQKDRKELKKPLSRFSKNSVNLKEILIDGQY